MGQIIIRIKDVNEDIEILDYIDGKEYFRVEKFSDFYKKIEKLVKSNKTTKRDDLKFIASSQIIAIGNECVVIKQEETKKIVTFEGKAYKINFPNAIYIIEHENEMITGIEAFAFKKYEGLNTKLFRYPLPNMLTGNKICMGSAPKKIKHGNFEKALEAIIFTQYTHRQVDNIKSFSSTKKYFEYIEKKDFPYKLLIPDGNKLRDKIGSI